MLAHARQIANTDSNGLTDAQGLILANDAQTQIQVEFVKRRRSLFLVEAYASITANEISGGVQPGQFAFPGDMLFLKELEVNLVTPFLQGNYVTPGQIDESNLTPGQSLDFLRVNQNVNTPQISIRGQMFELFPTLPSTTTVPITQAIRLWYYTQEVDFSSTSSTLSYPFYLNYYCLSYYIGALWALYNDDKALHNSLMQKSMEAITKIIDMLQSGIQTPTQAKSLGQTGWNL